MCLILITKIIVVVLNKNGEYMESINIALQELVVDLKQHEKLIAKLKRQGFIQEES